MKIFDSQGHVLLCVKFCMVQAHGNRNQDTNPSVMERKIVSRLDKISLSIGLVGPMSNLIRKDVSCCRTFSLLHG